MTRSKFTLVLLALLTLVLAMPAFAGGVQVKRETARPIDSVQGVDLYNAYCAVCHGKDGKGNTTLGAPDLTDDYWLYGNSTEALHETIANGRHGSMPAWGETLGDTRTRLVAAYVWSLSHKPGAARTAQ